MPPARRMRMRSIEARVVVAAEDGGADFGIEVDQRRVHRVLVLAQELDRGRLHVAHVLVHAAARVEQEPEMQRRRNRLVARAEELNLLRLAALDHLEVVLGQPRDRRPAAIGDDHSEVHEIDADCESAAGPGRTAGATVTRTAMAAAQAACVTGPPRGRNESEDFIPADAEHLRPAPPVRIDALEPVAPLDREQRAERRRRLEARCRLRCSSARPGRTPDRGRMPNRGSRRAGRIAPQTTPPTRARRRHGRSGSAPTDSRGAGCRSCRRYTG